MKTTDYNIRYLVVHVIAACDWRVLNYGDKMQFHHMVSATGKHCLLKPLDAAQGCIDIVFVGSDLYAERSEPLFGLLLDLWIEHQDAKIVYAGDLYQHRVIGPVETAAHWLTEHIPHPVRQGISNLLILKTIIPIL